MANDLVPKHLFHSVADITNGLVLLLRPFLNADWDVVPNNDSALVYELECILRGFQRFALWRDAVNREMHIVTQPFSMTSFSFPRLGRCGGLQIIKKLLLLHIHKSIIPSYQLLHLINIPVKSVVVHQAASHHRTRCSFPLVLFGPAPYRDKSHAKIGSHLDLLHYLRLHPRGPTEC